MRFCYLDPPDDLTFFSHSILNPFGYDIKHNFCSLGID